MSQLLRYKEYSREEIYQSSLNLRFMEYVSSIVGPQTWEMTYLISVAGFAIYVILAQILVFKDSHCSTISYSFSPLAHSKAFQAISFLYW